MVDQSTTVEDCRREVRLTARGRDVLSYLALGWETKYIAEELGVSPYTARNHIENLRVKLARPVVWRPSWWPCDSVYCRRNDRAWLGDKGPKDL